VTTVVFTSPLVRISPLLPDILLHFDTSEDTFLLLDALEQEAENLKALQPQICLEIG
jgi:release factor glutamine methyltransferase